MGRPEPGSAFGMAPPDDGLERHVCRCCGEIADTVAQGSLATFRAERGHDAGDGQPGGRPAKRITDAANRRGAFAGPAADQVGHQSVLCTAAKGHVIPDPMADLCRPGLLPTGAAAGNDVPTWMPGGITSWTWTWWPGWTVTTCREPPRRGRSWCAAGPQ